VNVIVDTCVWSEAFRKSPVKNIEVAARLKELIEAGAAVMLGPIRQEVLSGIKDIKQFRKLREALRFFPDVLVRSPDYELAADFFNRCRSLGIQGSNTDFLICAVAHSRKMPIYTTDKDFLQFKKHLQFSLI
jgi:hypothetical protein